MSTRTFTFTVAEPTSLPNPGFARAVNTNNPGDVAPYAVNSWIRSLFWSYGSGSYVADYSAGGGFVIAGSGGHSHPANINAAVFDFTDMAWKVVLCTNAVVNPNRSSDYTEAELNPTPYYDVIGSEVPSPPHQYRQNVGIPAAWGGGPKGSIALLGRSAVSTSGVIGTSAVHRFDLSTGLWSRWIDSATGDIARMVSYIESDALFDDATGRAVAVRTATTQNANAVKFLDTTTSTVTTPSIVATSSGARGSCVIHPLSRYLIMVRQTGALWTSLDTPDRWRTLNVSWAGTPIGDTTKTVANAFIYHPGKDAFYWLPVTGGADIGYGQNQLWKLTPPASNYDTSPWTVSSETITLEGGGLLHEHGASYEPNIFCHYRSLVYVEKLGCLAWIPGGHKDTGEQFPVYLIRPN